MYIETVTSMTLDFTFAGTCPFGRADADIDQHSWIVIGISGVRNGTYAGNVMSMHFNFYWHRMLLEDCRYILLKPLPFCYGLHR